MDNHRFEPITIAELAHVTGGGWKSKVFKWVADKVDDAKAWVSLRAEEFGKLPIDKKVTTVAAGLGGLSAPIAAGAAVYNAVKK
jgi:bacteriocin-like protein